MSNNIYEFPSPKDNLANTYITRLCTLYSDITKSVRSMDECNTMLILGMQKYSRTLQDFMQECKEDEVRKFFADYADEHNLDVVDAQLEPFQLFLPFE